MLGQVNQQPHGQRQPRQPRHVRSETHSAEATAAARRGRDWRAGVAIVIAILQVAATGDVP